MSDILNEVVTRFIWETAGAEEGSEKLREAIAKIVAGHKEAKEAGEKHKESISSLGKVAAQAGEAILSKLGPATLGLAGLGAVAAAGMFVAARKIGNAVDETEEHYKRFYDETIKLGKESANISLAPETEKAGENLKSLREQYKKVYEEREKLLPDYAKPGQNYAQSHGVAGAMTRWSVRAKLRLQGTSLEGEEQKQDMLQQSILKDIERSKQSIVKATEEQLGLAQKINLGDSMGAAELKLELKRKEEIARLDKIEEESMTKMPQARQNINEKYDQLLAKQRREIELNQMLLGINNEISSVTLEADDRAMQTADLQIKAANARKQAARGYEEITQADTALKQATRNKEQLQLTRDMSLNNEQAHTRELWLQVKGRDDLARLAAKEAAYVREMATLRFSGDQAAMRQKMANHELEKEDAYFQEYGYKSDSQVGNIAIRRKQQEIRRGIWSQRHRLNGGLINVQRNMAGQVIGGFNPLTGKQEDHTYDPIGGTSEQGVHTTGVQGASLHRNGPGDNSMATGVGSAMTQFEQRILDYVKRIAENPGLK